MQPRFLRYYIIMQHQQDKIMSLQKFCLTRTLVLEEYMEIIDVENCSSVALLCVYLLLQWSLSRFSLFKSLSGTYNPVGVCHHHTCIVYWYCYIIVSSRTFMVSKLCYSDLYLSLFCSHTYTYTHACKCTCTHA